MADLNNSLEVKRDHHQTLVGENARLNGAQERNFTSSSQRNLEDNKPSGRGNGGQGEELVLPEISSKNGGSLSIQEMAVNN